MSDNTGNQDSELRHRDAKLIPDMNPRYPLCHIAIAVHLGIPVFLAKDADENLRRVKALVKTHRELGVHLLTRDDKVVTEDDINPEMIAAHEGQKTNLGTYTAADFDDHLLDIIASRTGKPRVSYVHIRKHTPRVGYPVDIYQEIDDKSGEELRRVEVFLDGQHLWVEDNFTGTGETDKDDTRFDGLVILNARPGQTAKMISEDDFGLLWGDATDESCCWIEVLYENVTPDFCADEQTRGSAYCAKHHEIAKMMFPRLFETA